jgi:23S rRNA (cytosine1962-C5)-methyltransferase
VDGYRLIDVGDEARLERFGPHVVARPLAGARDERELPGRWSEADLRFDRERGWTTRDRDATVPLSWLVPVEGLELELRPTPAGQVGLFPEHLRMLPWLRARVADCLAGRDPTGDPVRVLHLFAYTGAATLALSQAGAAVAHVDASRPTVAWARRNADRNGLADRPVRWLVDDAVSFVAREARRGHSYDGLVLDPPAYGHGSPTRRWEIDRDLDDLLVAAAGILDPGGFVLLTAHSVGYGDDRLGKLLARSLRRPGSTIETGTLALDTQHGRRVAFGAFARSSGVA